MRRLVGARPCGPSAQWRRGFSGDIASAHACNLTTVAAGNESVEELLKKDVKEFPVMVYMKGTPEAPQASSA